MTGFNGKMQGFQRLSAAPVGFALIQLDSDKVALFSGDYSSSKTSDFSRAQVFAPDFYRSEAEPWWSFENTEVLKLSDLDHWAKAQLGSKATHLSWSEPQFSDFSAQVGRINTAFESHELHKAVPTVFSKAERGGEDPSFVQLLARAVLNRGNRLLYAFVLPEQGIIGATPEILFEYDSQAEKVKSMALAGTRATEQVEDIPLLTDPKEIHEHNLVLFEIKEKLAAFGEVDSGFTEEWNIGALTHLRTDIELTPKASTSADQLFYNLERSLHPTPALGVSSENLNFTWLKDLPGSKPRHRFGAPFGVWLPEYGAKVLVAIRNIQWTESEWLLGSGCGYLPESQIDREWKELELKRASVKALFEVLPND